MNNTLHISSSVEVKPRVVTLFSCSKLPEFDWLKRNTLLKTDIMQKHEGASDPSHARVLEAAELVELHVFKRMDYKGDGHAFLNRLLHQAYAREQVAQALAKAWLSDQEYFELPRRSRWHLVHKLWAQVLFSLLLSIGLLSLGLKVLRHSHPNFAVALLALPPLLGIVGFCLLFPILWLVKRLIFQHSQLGLGGNT